MMKREMRRSTLLTNLMFHIEIKILSMMQPLRMSRLFSRNMNSDSIPFRERSQIYSGLSTMYMKKTLN